MGKQGVAVRFGGGDKLRPDCAGRSDLVFEHDWLLEHRFKRRVQRTGDGVADAARWKRTDYSNRARRINVLRDYRAGPQCRGGRSRAYNKTTAIHLFSLCVGTGCNRPNVWTNDRSSLHAPDRDHRFVDPLTVDIPELLEVRTIKIGEFLAEIGDRGNERVGMAALSIAARNVVVTFAGVPLGAKIPTQR